MISDNLKSVSSLTHGVVPAVDSKQAAAGHRDDGRHCQMRQRIGSHVGDRRVGGELQYHDDVLLHLLLKHEWTLWKETLMKRQSMKERGKGAWGGRGKSERNRGMERGN